MTYLNSNNVERVELEQHMAFFVHMHAVGSRSKKCSALCTSYLCGCEIVLRANKGSR